MPNRIFELNQNEIPLVAGGQKPDQKTSDSKNDFSNFEIYFIITTVLAVFIAEQFIT